MPLRYEIDADLGLVTVTATGTLRYDDVTAAFLERIADPEYRPGMHLLLDGREAIFEFASDDISRLVEFYESRRADRGTGFRFALVSGLDVTFGMGRMFEVYADKLPEDIGVFRDFDEARRWVTGLDG